MLKKIRVRLQRQLKDPAPSKRLAQISSTVDEHLHQVQEPTSAERNKAARASAFEEEATIASMGAHTVAVAATTDTTEGSSVEEEKIIGDELEDLAERNENVAGEDTPLSMVLQEIRELRKDLRYERQSSIKQPTVPFSSEKFCSSTPILWDKVTNLHELLLVSKVFCTEHRLQNTLYIKCTACSTFVNSIEGRTYRGNVKRHDAFPYGLLIKKDDEADLWSGTGRRWVRWKFKLKRHVEGADHSTIHFKGLQMMEHNEIEESRVILINKHFIICAIEVIKSKSAARHYETKLANFEALGVDIGNKQHSRKQFNDVVESICSTIDERLDQKLSYPLKSTGHPPHFFLTFDKSTPQRESNQAVMLVAMIDGSRVAYFLGAPKVYSIEEGEREISGGQSESLVAQIFLELQTRIPNVDKKFCAGAVADGQYANERFRNAFFTAVGVQDEFSFVIWDPSHFMDLCAKKFISQPYLKRLCERAARFHTKLGYGKMQAIARSIGEQMDEKTLVTKSLSTTRFIASTLQSFASIQRCFHHYVQAMYNFGGMRHNTDESFSEDEYMLVGQDFVIDLLLVSDILKQLVDLMVVSQELKLPCWKVLTNSKTTLENLELMENNLQSVDPSVPFRLNKRLWPNSAGVINGVVQDKKYNGVALVNGWLVDTSSATNSKNPVSWRYREPSDCLQDAIDFVRKLRFELERRLKTSVPDAVEVLGEAFDLSKLVCLQAGRWSTPLQEALLTESSEAAQKAFVSFFNNLKRLPHLQDYLREENAVEVFQQAMATFKWIVWSESPEASSVRKQIFETDEAYDGSRPDIFSPDLNCQARNFDQSFSHKSTVANFKITLKEENLITLMYVDSEIYTKFGKPFCLAFDVAMAKGGCEAIVESLYSVMNAQSQYGGQSNEVLVNRTKVDWHCPSSSLGVMDFITDAAKFHQSKHCVPYTRLNYGASAIVKRLRREKGRIPDKI
ncbi:uncharacterized protein LOC108672979 isoform X2 [Hyalella azteca]|uniref:Uncharacterized protein LOC108672979 isoform X2 n=1 Tax=Hyalella azteca TaxID=294128 RepID=A0A979FKN1_HYAAZ|nr:uncharacterized protein LOC108672979 isoform X2 [Hyalella azteca]